MRGEQGVIMGHQQGWQPKTQGHFCVLEIRNSEFIIS